jgi:hypothetical protein
MQTINSYIYDNSVIVQLDTDPDIKTRNRVVYTRTIKVYQGVDNIIKIKTQNQDQKPIDLTGYTLTFTVVDDYTTTNNTTLIQSSANAIFQTNVIISNAATGVGTITIPAENMTGFTRTNYTYAINYSAPATGNLTLPAYIDDNWGAAGQLQVVQTAYPAFTSNIVVNEVENLGTISGNTVVADIEDLGTL